MLCVRRSRRRRAPSLSRLLAADARVTSTCNGYSKDADTQLSLSLSLNTHKQRSLSLITNKHLLSLSARHRYSESLTPGMVTERMALVKIHTLPDAGHGSSVSRKLGVTDRPRDTLLVAWQGVYSDTPSRTLADTSAAAFVVRRGTRVFYPVIGAQTSSTLSYSVGLWAKWGGALPLRLCGCAAVRLWGFWAATSAMGR